MKTRFLSFALALVLALELMPSVLAAESGYSDVPEDHWAAENVRRSTELGIFQGVGGGRFGLGQPISRAAFVTALVRLFGWEEVSPEGIFSDVPKDKWYAAAVETAAAHDALPAGSRAFRPEDNITREEMAVIIVRGLGYAPLAPAAAELGSPFTDVTASEGFIAIAYDTGIISGMEKGRFAPGDTATREQAAAVLVRLHERWHAVSQRVSAGAYGEQIAVAAPEAVPGGEMPATPLEPIAELYAALRRARAKGMYMEGAILNLTAGGIRTIVANGEIVESAPVTVEEVKELLAGGANDYYSTRYESAYCIYQPNAYPTATVWYQSEESMAAKLQLARMFGVTKYSLV